MYRLSHDIVYVNYFLFNKHISKDKTGPLCGKPETVNHLFLECSVFVPLNRIVLYLLRKCANNKIRFSERVFRYFELPPLGKIEKQIALILLSESRYVIWTCRNLKKYDNKSVCSFQVISKFLNKIKFRILADRKRLSVADFLEFWVVNGFCNLDLIKNQIIFKPYLDISYYTQKKNIQIDNFIS